MTDTRVEPEAPPEAPFLRLVGVFIVVSALVSAAASIAFDLGLERMEEARRLQWGPLDDLLMGRLRLASLARLGTEIASGLGVAVLLLAVARRSRGVGRLASTLAAITALAQIVPPVLMCQADIGQRQAEFESLGLWFDMAAVARTITTGALLLVARQCVGAGRWRRPSLVAIVAALAAAVVVLQVTFGSQDPSATPWWYETVAHLRVLSWIDLLGAIALGLGLGLATAADHPDAAAPFDRTAAGGLRLARTTVWLRVVVGLSAVALVIAGNIAVRNALNAATYDPTVAAFQLPVAHRLAPWAGYLECLLGIALVGGIMAAVLQRRSGGGALLVGVGSTLSMLGVAIAFGLNGLLHGALVAGGTGLGGTGEGMRHYVELTMALDPTVRWIGLGSVIATLTGLIAIARRIDVPVRRAIRFLTLAALLTGTWLYGREQLEHLGLWVLLLLPIGLGAAIWAMLDLTTFLGEVADGLAPPELAEPPGATDPAPSPHR